jgi:hypothetical protein
VTYFFLGLLTGLCIGLVAVLIMARSARNMLESLRRELNMINDQELLVFSNDRGNLENRRAANNGAEVEEHTYVR